MTLQEEMIRYRAKNRIKQAVAAQQAGVSQQTWCSVENDLQKPSKVTEAKIRLLIEQELEGNE